MTVNRKVIDLSHWNTVTSWPEIKAAGIVGVIHKATESTGYVDPNYASRKTAALAQGMLWGAYHFAHAGNVVEQVANFLNTSGIDPAMLYALDWEDTPAGTMSAAQAQQFISLLEGKIGTNRCVIYSGNTLKERLGSSINPFFAARRLWLAHWGVTPEPQASWGAPWIWQYSDGVNGPTPHSCPGVTGALDSNSWAGTDAELISQWAGTPPPPPPPPLALHIPTLTVSTSGDMHVIVNGVTIQ